MWEPQRDGFAIELAYMPDSSLRESAAVEKVIKREGIPFI
jgi:hypothetical protein